LERKDVEDLVSKCWRFEVQGCRGRDRPRKTWEQSVNCDIRKYGMQRVGPFNRDKWSCCGSTRAIMEKRML